MSVFDNLDSKLVEREYVPLVLKEVGIYKKMSGMIKEYAKELSVKFDEKTTDRMILRFVDSKTQLSKYKKLYDKKIKGVLVEYIKKPFGRVYPRDMLSLCCMKTQVRNGILYDIFVDLDIKGASNNIILSICHKFNYVNELKITELIKYNNNREDFLIEIAEAYDLRSANNRDIVKELMISFTFLGGTSVWLEKYANVIYNKSGTPSCNNKLFAYREELKRIALKLKENNPEVYEYARNLKLEKFLKYHPGELFCDLKNNVLGGFFATYIFEVEYRIVRSVINYLITTPLLRELIGIYEYDGVKLLKSLVDEFNSEEYGQGITGVTNLLNNKTEELTGFKLEWVNKSMEYRYVLNENNKRPTEEFGEIEELIGEESEEIKEEIKDTINEKSLKDILNIIEKYTTRGDLGGAELLQYLYPDNFIYIVDSSGMNGKWYCWNGLKWLSGTSYLKHIINYKLTEYLLNLLEPYKKYENLNPTDEDYKLYFDCKKNIKSFAKSSCENSYGINGLISIAMVKYEKRNFEFDLNENLTGFNNGVLDISSNCFRPYKLNDYMTTYITFDYIPMVVGLKVLYYDDKGIIKERIVTNEDITEIYKTKYNAFIKILKTIMPKDDELEYLLIILASGFSGISIECFFIFNGGGRNGKGLLTEYIKYILGQYCIQLNSKVLYENQERNLASSANTELAKLHKVRLVLAKEPPASVKLQNSIIKEITGGGCMSARKLYSNDKEVKLMNTTIIETNVLLQFAENPTNAETSRLCDIYFGSKFSTDLEECDVNTGVINHIYEANPYYKTKDFREYYIDVFLNIIVSKLLKLSNANYNIDNFKPESVKQRSSNYMQESFDIHNVFIQLFEERQENNISTCLTSKGLKKDEDWTITQISELILCSSELKEYKLDNKISNKKYINLKEIKEFFQTNSKYKPLNIFNNHTKMYYLQGYRLKSTANHYVENK
jgi:phage/plasmid-associated DNA primase